MKKEITDRQQEILDFIAAQVNKRGYPPSVREIGNAVGLSSTASVHNQLNQLEKKGFIRKDKSTTRGLVVIGGPKNNGHIDAARLQTGPAGQAESYAKLPSHLIEDGEQAFIIQVPDGSLKTAGVQQGDQLIFQEGSNAGQGDIVATKINGRIAVQEYSAKLAAAQIAGRAVGLYRKFGQQA